MLLSIEEDKSPHSPCWYYHGVKSLRECSSVVLLLDRKPCIIFTNWKKVIKSILWVEFLKEYFLSLPPPYFIHVNNWPFSYPFCWLRSIQTQLRSLPVHLQRISSEKAMKSIIHIEIRCLPYMSLSLQNVCLDTLELSWLINAFLF